MIKITPKNILTSIKLNLELNIITQLSITTQLNSNNKIINHRSNLFKKYLIIIININNYHIIIIKHTLLSISNNL
jgi:hypothetical protein